MQKVIRPMLACSRNVTIDDLQSLQMPMYASVKQDGIRCRLDVFEGSVVVPHSRSLKPIPNCHIVEWACNHGIPGLDGEIVIPGWSFNDIQSWVMTAYTRLEPFEFRVFDFLSDDPKDSFQARLVMIANRLSATRNKRTKLIKQHLCTDPHQIECEFEYQVDHGEEGLILRSPSGLYKSGRSTWNQAYSLKMKAFEDDEAIIVGYYPLEENQNESILNELGLKKKSSHKDNKIFRELLGGFVVEHKTFGTFRIGSGPTLEQRKRWWKRRTALIGEEITFKFQHHGMKDKPRTPILKSINSLLQ